MNEFKRVAEDIRVECAMAGLTADPAKMTWLLLSVLWQLFRLWWSSRHPSKFRHRFQAATQSPRVPIARSTHGTICNRIVKRATKVGLPLTPAEVDTVAAAISRVLAHTEESKLVTLAEEGDTDDWQLEDLES